MSGKAKPFGRQFVASRSISLRRYNDLLHLAIGRVKGHQIARAAPLDRVRIDLPFMLIHKMAAERIVVRSAYLHFVLKCMISHRLVIAAGSSPDGAA